ncbi:MAG: SusC/RagA family TonB-linked outer membrane protein [Flavobacteriaceae bacterium]
MKNIKIKELLILLFIFSSIISFSQTITGVISSADDDFPLPDVSVVEKGTNNGTITDFDGNYTIKVKENATLVFSYLGMKTQEVLVTDTEISLKLENDGTTLDEIVVVGYGSVKKSDLTGAVSKVDMEKAQVVPTANITEQLRGRVAGVKVDVNSLRPGGTSKITFRGTRGLGGLSDNDAIYIVDGVEVNAGDITAINQDDIKSIELLKDASAQAIYGSKAGNGVVLITTKRGKSKKMKISYHGFTTSSSIKKNFETYSPEEFAQLRREAKRTLNGGVYEDDNAIFEPNELQALNDKNFTNWEDEVLRNGSIINNAINISGGSDKTKVFSSLSHYRNNGLIPTSAYNRKTFRLNLDQTITSKLSANFNLALTNTTQDKESEVYNLITLSPLGQSHNDDGTITQYPVDDNSYVNPLWNIAESNNDVKGNNYSFSFVPKYDITNDLTYKINSNFSKGNNNNGKYLSSLHQYGVSDNGVATISNSLSEKYLVENILTFKKELNDDNKLHLTAVQAIQENKYENLTTIGKGFENEDNGYDGIAYAIGGNSVTRNKSKVNFSSFMGRARYNFKNKYLFTATYRADGASVNKVGSKWVNTTAFAFAWKAHKESFLENIEQINSLKFRVSYGSLPNQAKQSLLSLASAEPYQYIFDGETVTGFLPGNRLVSNDLKHEVTASFNIGTDFNLFNNILEGSVNYYYTTTDDLLLFRTLPAITGFDYTIINGGVVENKGLELELTGNIIQKENFKWSVSATYAHNRNKLVDLYTTDASGNPINDYERRYIVGESLNPIYAYETDGIWQLGEDWEGSPQGDNNGMGSNQANLDAGSIRVKDINGRDDDGNLTGIPDGKIDDADRKFVDRNPDWFGSFSTNIDFKGFELFADFYTVQGATRQNPYLYSFNQGGTLQGKLNGIKVNYWTPENPSNEFPRPRDLGVDPYLSSLSIKDASYLRLRTLSLGYDFKNFKLSNNRDMDVKVYLTGTNLFTITDYKGYSPEVSAGGYPDAKSYTLGLKVKL